MVQKFIRYWLEGLITAQQVSQLQVPWKPKIGWWCLDEFLIGPSVKGVRAVNSEATRLSGHWKMFRRFYR
jgi:hypothetical protein